MLESSSTHCAPNYLHIVQTPKGATWVVAQLNYITDIVLELKAKLEKSKATVKDIKKQLFIIHRSLINKVRHSRKLNLSISTQFQYKYPSQSPKNKKPNFFARQ